MNTLTPNRLTTVLIVALFCYLGLFSWNARTGYLDTVAERSGLEIVGYVLSPAMMVKDTVAGWWNSYIALVDVAEENARLKEELKKAERLIVVATEERAELERLRQLFGIDALRDVSGFGARIIAMRFGPQAVLKTMTVNKGYLDGAVIGTPVVAPSGVVGRVHRTAPHAATVLLVTDPGFRLAVISQDSRTPGILKGMLGNARHLEVTYVAQNANIAEGEMLITAGIDGGFPKGIPVGVVTKVEPGHEILFQKVLAEPIVNLELLEEVALLRPEGSAPPLLQRLPNPVDPDPLFLPLELEQKLQSDQGTFEGFIRNVVSGSGKRNTSNLPSGDAATVGRQSTTSERAAPVSAPRRNAARQVDAARQLTVD